MKIVCIGQTVIADCANKKPTTEQVQVDPATKEQENQQVFAGLKEIFGRYKGRQIVYLDLIDSGRVIKTEPQYWMDLSLPGALRDLGALLGPDAIKLV